MPRLYPFLKGQGSFVRYAGDFITSLELGPDPRAWFGRPG